MLKGIEPEEEESRGIKREREGDIDEEKSSETMEKKSSETTSSGQEEEEEEESEFEMDGEEEYEESEEEEGEEDTCVYSEYEDRSGEPDKLDIDSEDEGDEDIRAYVLKQRNTKGIESEEEGSRDIKREREGNTDEEKSSETTEEKSSGQEEEEEESEFEMDGEEEYEESEEEEGEDTCVYSEYEDRSGEPDKLDIDSEDEGDEDIRAYVLQMWKTEDFDAPEVYIKGRYLCVFPPCSPYRDYWWERAQGCAQFAVKHYNKRRAGPDVQLEFSKLTNVTSFGWCFYNVTFEAVNVMNGEKKVYQAKVERDFYDKFKVEFFRKKRNN